MVYSKKAVF